MPEKKKINRTQDINPQVKDVKIGIRSLRKIKVYPLSLADQLEITDMITEAIGVFFSLEAEGKMSEGPPTEFVVFVLQMIKDNIGDLIIKVTGEEDSDAVLKELSNAQLADIVAIVYKDNFADPLEKIVDTFQAENEETMTGSILERLRSPSVVSTEDTSSKTSSEKATGKAE